MASIYLGSAETFDNLDTMDVVSAAADSTSLTIAATPQATGTAYTLKLVGTVGGGTATTQSFTYAASNTNVSVPLIGASQTVSYDVNKIDLSAIWTSLMSGDDSLVLAGGNDNVFGGAGNDYIAANGGTDVIKGGAGDDAINGGTGIDTAVYTGTRAEYDVKLADGVWTITDGMPSRDGTDTAIEVERLRFSDKKLALDMGTTQAGGETALLIGAVLGRTLAFANDAVKQGVLGNVVALFDDAQYNMQILSGAVMRLNHDSLDIWTALAGGNDLTSIATRVLTTVNGAAPSQSALSAAVAQLTTERGTSLEGTWLAAQALSSANQTQVDLVGLAASGMTYQ
jgi:hypothetical protein